MKRLSIFLFYFFLVSCIPLIAQKYTPGSPKSTLLNSSTDSSQLSFYNRLINQSIETNPSLAIKYADKAGALAEETNNLNDKVQAFLALGLLHRELSEFTRSLHFYHRVIILLKDRNGVFTSELIRAYEGSGICFTFISSLDSSRIYLNRGLLLAKSINDFASEADISSDLGNASLQENKLADALSLYINSAKLHDSLSHDKVGLSKAFANIANLQNILGNYDKAMVYIKKIEELNNVKPDLSLATLAYVYNLKGRIYRRNKEPDLALRAYDQAFKFYEKLGSKYGVAEVVLSVGNIYFDQGKFKTAEEKYRKVLSITRLIGDSVVMAHAYSGLGSVLHQLNDFRLAAVYIDSCRMLATKIKLPYLIFDSYLILSQINEAQHNYQGALLNHKLYALLKDSLNVIDNANAKSEVEAKYQTEKTQKEIEILKIKDQLKETFLARRKTIEYGAFAMATLLSIIGILLFNRYRIAHQIKRIQEIDNIRNTIAQDLHDDIGSTLSSIKIISSMGSQNSLKESMNNSFAVIEGHASKMLNNMADIIWSVNANNDTLEEVILHMKEFAEEICEPKNISYHFNETDIVKNLKVDLIVRKNLFLIFKESLTNALKYSNCTEISIHIKLFSATLIMHISDNGMGFDLQHVKSGNGLINMKSRSAMMNGQLHIKTSPGQGTSVVISTIIA